MTKFSEFVERRKGTYVSCSYTEETTQAIAAWCVQNLIPDPLDPKKYHTTILYSRKPVENAADVVKLEPGLEFTAKGFHLFDSKEDPLRAALVIELDAPQIVAAHKRLISAGGTHDYDDFTPHLTVSYLALKSTDLSVLPVPAFKFKLKAVTVEPLDLNWKDR